VRNEKSEKNSGIVYLVGAGPGDARLLTLRAAELLATADLVALDALVSKDISARIPKTTDVVYVGKRASAHTLPQDKINQLLIDEAKKGRRVVRLKGGDPFVFGRGGEEAEEIIAAGVPVEIVPGISSSIAGPAYAGIPVTHRAHATSLTLVTAHESDESTGIKWPALAQLDGTIVFMMGFANLPSIVSKLIEHGMSAERPVAVVSNATRPDQRTVAGTLRTIVDQVEGARLQTPALIVVGDVVRLRDTINWFETKPLFGKRVIVTRARDQASQLVSLLVDSGANVLQFPTIEIAPPESFDSLDRVVNGRYDVLVFSSTNGVRAYFDRLFESGRDARVLTGVRIAAVGDTTAAELRSRGIAPDVIPPKFQSIALLPLLDEDQKGIRTAVIRAAEGSDELIDELRRRGGQVDLGVAYRTVAVESDLEELRSLIASRSVDAVTFTSASTVDHFFGPLTGDERKSVLEQARIASIGPVTSDAIRRFGRDPDMEAASASVHALHDAVVKSFRAATTARNLGGGSE
jgi:uroporphyrinogen III methyltransferase / synthase